MGSIEFRNIAKSFPGVKALDGVSFCARSGQVVALLGENGAGKSTLLKILNGDYHPDSGQYLIDDREMSFNSPRDAIDAGISIIYQERQIVPYLSVAENIFMEDLPVHQGGMIDFKLLNKRTQEILDEFDLPFKPQEQVRHLSIAHQQMVEIMKAYRRKPRIIAFDEPTASLSDHQINILFKIIADLKKRDIIVLYVSHRIKELFQITDEIVILKDGQFIKQVKTSEIEEGELIRLMVGRDLGNIFQSLKRSKPTGKVVLDVRKLNSHFINDISFQVHQGEIVGFSGLVGSGRTEVMRAIYGADQVLSGEIFFEGKKVRITSPKRAIRLGIGLCPEDRKDQGIFGQLSVRENISCIALDKVCRYQVISQKLERKLAVNLVNQLTIRTPHVEKRIRELSGGNQQKSILARWIIRLPKLLILDEPTKGIDVGSKAEIYQLACDLASQGLAIIFISSELLEVIGVSDRILVMCDGRISGEIQAKDASEEKLLNMAMKHDEMKEAN